jgi:hypothetical protein
MENQNLEQNFDLEGSTNGYGFERAIRHHLTKGVVAGPPQVRAHSGCGHTQQVAMGPTSSPTAPSRCPLPP